MLKQQEERGWVSHKHDYVFKTPDMMTQKKTELIVQMIVKDLEKFIEGFLYWSFLHKFMALERKTVK